MGKIKILVAEDDIDDQFIFDNFLSDREDIAMLPYVGNGLEVFSFLDAQAADQLPDMIILDHNMPKMNGRQTLELLKQKDRYASIPVFIYSTYIDSQLIDICTALGAAKVATKPISYAGYQELMNDFIETIVGK